VKDNTPLIGLGSVTVNAPTPAPIPQPTMTGIQQQGPVVLNSPMTLMFNGSNLTNEVRVTVASCENPQTNVVSTNQIRHQCTPRATGSQSVGWKVKDNTPLIGLGSVTVNAPTPAPVNIQSVSANPPSVQAGQLMTFNATVDNSSDVARAELAFPGTSVAEQMVQSGNSFSRQRPMTSPGNNRSFEIRIFKKSGGQPVVRQGTFSVR
jgi:hypothetical protein